MLCSSSNLENSVTRKFEDSREPLAGISIIRRREEPVRLSLMGSEVWISWLQVSGVRSKGLGGQVLGVRWASFAGVLGFKWLSVKLLGSEEPVLGFKWLSVKLVESPSASFTAELSAFHSRILWVPSRLVTGSEIELKSICSAAWQAVCHHWSKDSTLRAWSWASSK